MHDSTSPRSRRRYLPRARDCQGHAIAARHRSSTWRPGQTWDAGGDLCRRRSRNIHLVKPETGLSIGHGGTSRIV